MRYGWAVIVSALALFVAFPLYATPAQAQDPGRILRPLTTPLRMILRAPRARVPRAHRSARAYRASRATRARARREIASESARAPARRQLARSSAVFWPIATPDAFEDMLGYAFWPHEYGREFWSHGPADILRAMTAPTAAFASQDDEDRPTRRLQTALVGTADAVEDRRAICVARVQDQAMRPLDRIDQTIRLTVEQQQHLNALRANVRAAIENEAAACLVELPATQPERLRAMIDGMWAMRYAEFRIRPALETFYGSLTEEQTAQLAGEPQTVGSNEATPTITPAAVCKEAVVSDANPFEPIQRSLRPTDGQRKSLQMLYGASMEMAQFLTTTCPIETPSTPITRLDAASDRVMALLHAAMGIEPILGEFYASLSDQQRRRFNATLR